MDDGFRLLEGGAFGDSTCGQVACDEPAVWHLRLEVLGADGVREVIHACARHLDEVPSSLYQSMHPFGAVCNMPGSVWLDEPDELSRCAWSVDDEVYALDVAST